MIKENIQFLPKTCIHCKYCLYWEHSYICRLQHEEIEFPSREVCQHFLKSASCKSLLNKLNAILITKEEFEKVENGELTEKEKKELLKRGEKELIKMKLGEKISNRLKKDHKEIAERIMNSYKFEYITEASTTYLIKDDNSDDKYLLKISMERME